MAELTPVLISGSTVSRATLHNQDEIDRKQIHIGAGVLVEKAGEIIPAIVKVIRHAEGALPYSIFDSVDGKCPSCGGPISQEEGFVAWRCTNFACPAQAVTSIKHFAARKALDGALPYATDVRSIKFLFLPAEHDPDSYVREFGQEAFAEQIKQAMPLSRFLLEAASAECDLQTADRKSVV